MGALDGPDEPSRRSGPFAPRTKMPVDEAGAKNARRGATVGNLRATATQQRRNVRRKQRALAHCVMLIALLHLAFDDADASFSVLPDALHAKAPALGLYLAQRAEQQHER